MKDAGRKGQSMVEYTLLIILATAAFVGMFSMVKDAISERHKRGADGVGQGLLLPD